MHGCGIIFSQDGVGRFYRVSPLLFPQFGPYNKFLLPKDRDLPIHGLILRQQVFDFGYAVSSNAIPPLGQVDCPLVLGRDMLVWARTGVYGAAAVAGPPGQALPTAVGQPGANQTPGFLVNFFHTHAGVQRQWANKNITDIEAVGDGQLPYIETTPTLLLQGDTLMCTVQNLANVTLLAQIVLHGGEFDTETFGQEAGY